MLRRFLIVLFRHQLAAIFVAIAGLLAFGGLAKAVDLMHHLDRGIVLPGYVIRVDEKPAADPKEAPKYLPVIAFTDPNGVRREFAGPNVGKDRYAAEDKRNVSVIFDPDAPTEPLLKLPLLEQGSDPLILLVVASVLIGIGAFIAYRPQELAQFFQDRTFNEQQFAPTTGVLEGVPYIKHGRYPLELCEMTAYMASLAYMPGKDLKDHFDKHCPQYTHFQPFSNKDTEGFGFVHEGVGYVVMRGTMGWADWSRNLRAAYTKPTDLVPEGWTAPSRHWGFAEGWNVVRDDVEKWLATTPYASNPDMPFVFTGHSLGGALSFLGAWEFARRKRNVAAVITFGAARPGGADFKKEYDELGLGDRTLRLEFDHDIVPAVQALLGYQAVGHGWVPEKPPLLSEKSAAAAIMLSWLISSLGQNMFGKSIEEPSSPAPGKDAKPTEVAALAATSETKPSDNSKPKDGDQQKPKKRFVYNGWREILIRLILFAAFSGILALAAHKMQKRYALALTTMSYSRIRSQLAATLAETGSSMALEDQLRHAYDALEHRLKEIRGSTPGDPGPFAELKNLPNRIDSTQDLEWLNTFHAGRIW